MSDDFARKELAAAREAGERMNEAGERVAQGLEKLSRDLADAQRLREFAQFVVTLDDPHAVELRRGITLTEIIDRARKALAPPTGAERQK